MRRRIARRNARKNAFFFTMGWRWAGDASAAFFPHCSIFLHRSIFCIAAMQAQQCKCSNATAAFSAVQQCRRSNASAATNAAPQHTRRGGSPMEKVTPPMEKFSPHQWKRSPHRWKSSAPTDGKVHRSRAVASARLMPAFILAGISLLAARFILLSKSVRFR